MSQSIGCRQDQKIPVRNPDLNVIEDFAVITWFEQPGRFWKGQSLHQAVNVLRRQTGTALGTTAGDNLAAVGSCHAGTETVNALTLQYAWLKRSFHGVDLTLRGIGNSMIDWKMISQNRSGILCNVAKEFNAYRRCDLLIRILRKSLGRVIDSVGLF